MQSDTLLYKISTPFKYLFTFNILITLNIFRILNPFNSVLPYINEIIPRGAIDNKSLINN